MNTSHTLLSVVENGGYAHLFPVYRDMGFKLEIIPSVRKAQSWLKRNRPLVMVVEFSFDPSFRDRMCNLESLLASIQKEKLETKVFVLIEKESLARLEPVSQRYPIDQVLTFPIDVGLLKQHLSEIMQLAGE